VVAVNEADRSQINIIYSYIKRKRKILHLPIKCNMCKEKFSKYEFYTSTHICKSCWGKYIKMEREEKKDFQNEKVG
jgi:rRNA maturation endonuclease Nob1